MSLPRLSIGLPVYNGERYLAAAIGSILDQSFTDFDLIISNNASSDRTGEICRVFAATDSRIRYHRFDENQGAAANYNYTVDQARGEYFKWAAHDDICKPAFLESCVRELDADPGVVLCHSISGRIDENGQFGGIYPHEPECIEDDRCKRFARMISTPHLCIPVFGVMRRAVLNRTPRHGEYVGADRNLLAELALIGKIRLVDDCLFLRRDHADSSIVKHEDERERLAWFNPSQQGMKSYPTWRRLREYARSISAVPMPPSDRVRCYARLVRWLGGRHHSGRRIAPMLLHEAVGGIR